MPIATPASPSRRTYYGCVWLYAVVWAVWVLFLAYDALLHPYSAVQRGDADGRLVAFMVAYVAGCLAVTAWLVWRAAQGKRAGSLILHLSLAEFVGLVALYVVLNGFPAY